MDPDSADSSSQHVDLASLRLSDFRNCDSRGPHRQYLALCTRRCADTLRSVPNHTSFHSRSSRAPLSTTILQTCSSPFAEKLSISRRSRRCIFLAIASSRSYVVELLARLSADFRTTQRNIQQRYGGIDATSIFPVQVSALCNGVDGTISPWVTMPTANTSNTNAVYHDFRAFTTDSRPDWYTESVFSPLFSRGHC